MIKRIVVLQDESTIASELSGSARAPEPAAAAPSPHEIEKMVDDLDPQGGTISLREIGRRAARDAEREVIKRVLDQTNWNRKKAAQLLEVSYKTLLQKIKECGLAE